MAEQQRLPLSDLGTSRQFDPVGLAALGARDYTQRQGRIYSAPNDQLQADPGVGRAVAQAYAADMATPATGKRRKALEESYAALRGEVAEQYRYMTGAPHEGGLGIQVEPSDADPYQTPQELAEDLRTNKRLKVFKTTDDQAHEFFTPEENDQFRAVHDFFGHAAIGRGFSRHGEEAAYQSHVQMFSPTARAALASETRGQNSFLNYGPGGFPPNRMAALPSWAAQPSPRRPAARRRTQRVVGEQGSLF